MTKPERDKADATLYIGLMSGTSLDAIDSAIVDFKNGKVSLLACREHTISGEMRARIAAISHTGNDEIERLGRLDRELGELFAQATLELLRAGGIAADAIVAIGSHGQTIRHRPPSGAQNPNASFTLQIGDPNTIAECTGITTVADFRRRDIAAGGEGAPLAPAFHADVFARPGTRRAIINIGGIANVSVLDGTLLATGFDTGPGNTLLDHWIARTRGTHYDRGGQWAAEGEVLPALLQSLLLHPYMDKTGPRSTGKEAFNLDWLDSCLSEFSLQNPQNVQATLAEYTAETIARGLGSSGLSIDEVYVCGGGAHNTDLMRRLYRKLSPATLSSTTAIGMDPDWVEAAAFAWLARQTMDGLAGNASAVTGAKGPRVLGGIFPGGINGSC